MKGKNLMKFYNPFKPHIIQTCRGSYFIRVFKIPPGWCYLGDDDVKWFLTEGLAFHTDNLDKAKSKLTELYTQGMKNKVLHWQPNKN